MDELEEVLRSSEEEKRRLEQEQSKEQELFSQALTQAEKGMEYPREEVSLTSTEPTRAIGASSIERTTSVDHSQQSTGITDAEPKSTKETVRKNKQEESTEKSIAKSSLFSDKDRKENTDDIPALAKPRDVAEHNEEKEKEKKINKRPPTAKRANTLQNAEDKPSTKNVSLKGRRPSVERKRRDSIPNFDKKDETEKEEHGVVYGPREKNIYDVNALLKKPNRLNSATVRSREEYLRMQRDRLLQMKAIEREKQMSEVSARAVQERPRTAKAARGMMRGSLNAIGVDETLAARRAIVEKVKAELSDDFAS
ncbi:hypothetical protein KIN20_034672 [Parelaphostrongylus tenuis]|uniref:Uncharacterized protein n=1 Tax=Parelaphostrongylus tenuis TaxID=148309 RepID=A0AAD5WJU7_PARTN|nr:hypothetical protein KIN20_034672 [Parelaphostrongylus tenuis]